MNLPNMLKVPGQMEVEFGRLFSTAFGGETSRIAKALALLLLSVMPANCFIIAIIM